MNKLAYLRSTKEMTVRELAEKSKVSPTTINNLEQGNLKSHAVTIGKLANALDIDISELAEFIAGPKTDALTIVKEQSIGQNETVASGVAAVSPQF